MGLRASRRGTGNSAAAGGRRQPHRAPALLIAPCIRRRVPTTHCRAGRAAGAAPAAAVVPGPLQRRCSGARQAHCPMQAVDGSMVDRAWCGELGCVEPSNVRGCAVCCLGLPPARRNAARSPCAEVQPGRGLHGPSWCGAAGAAGGAARVPRCANAPWRAACMSSALPYPRYESHPTHLQHRLGSAAHPDRRRQQRRSSRARRRATRPAAEPGAPLTAPPCMCPAWTSPASCAGRRLPFGSLTGPPAAASQAARHCRRLPKVGGGVDGGCRARPSGAACAGMPLSMCTGLRAGLEVLAGAAGRPAGPGGGQARVGMGRRS